jgi:hypothetical protein
MSNLREYLKKNSRRTKRLLGMEYEQLIELIQSAELLEQQRQQERDKTKVRIIKKTSWTASILHY